MTRAWGPPRCFLLRGLRCTAPKSPGPLGRTNFEDDASCPWVRWRAQREEPSPAERGPGPGTAITLSTAILQSLLTVC